MNYAIRSGVTITASYAIRQTSRLLKNVEGSQREELMSLLERLQSKIRILSPAIDMIDLIAARGNTSLESAVTLTRSLRFEIQALGQRLERAAAAEEKARTNTKVKIQNDVEIKSIINEIKKLLSRIEDAVPMINLAITTSGASLSTTLPSTVSPSRLLQASTFLTAGDTQYSLTPDRAVQIGPTFVLSLYMLFAGYARPNDQEGLRDTAWKEVMHKARVKLRRVPMNLAFTDPTQGNPPSAESYEFGHLPGEARTDEFAYQLLLIEDLDDDRVHTFEENQPQPEPYDDIEQPGIREILPIHQISKLFYADTGKVLNIGSEGEINSPVLLLKRDINAIPPRRMMERDLVDSIDFLSQPDLDGHCPPPLKQSTADKGPWSLPPGLDPEWLAFEVYTESVDSEDDDDSESGISASRSRNDSRPASIDPHLTASLAGLHVNSSSPNKSPSVARSSQQPTNTTSDITTTRPPPWVNNIRTSLSLMELLIRLTSLQQFQQQSHLSITDELLNFFLEESASTGAGGDEEHRQRLRSDARRKVGWDPYDESPMKRHGEEYQYGGIPGSNQSPRWANSPGFYEEDEPPSDQYFIRSRSATPASPSPSVRPARPTTKHSGTPTGSIPYSPNPAVQSPGLAAKGRQPILRRQQTEERRKGSPLRPQTGMTDEGIGTSPGSEFQKE
ncbi:putativebinding protein [Phaeomoniella chlamydospora]|uniref:Putativebinding protein n=1 Tax=Phaeomoniella chlamydospora TaxID=158046 RepID=A0A0G2GLS0_PHACM|nr:putativebinding protein [Phaeomoniella chlamydospora]